MPKPSSLGVVPASPWAVLFGLDLQKKALYFRQVATMVKAGLSIGRSLQSAAPHTVGQLGNDMCARVEAGNPFSAVMRCYPHYFTSFEAALVEAGEMGGSLERRLEDLATYLERAYTLQRELYSKMVYPLLILHVGIFIPPLYLLVTGGLKAYLTATLSMLIPLYACVILGFLFFRLASNVSGLRRAADSIILYIPLFGALARKLAMARYLRGMSQLYHAGFLPSEAMKVAGDSCGNAELSSQLVRLIPLVDQGMSPSQALARLLVIPPTVLQLVTTGEQTGDTATMMERAADMMEQEAQLTIKAVMAIIPVVMLLIIGVIVGFYVVTFYTSTIKGIMNL